jgi:hypothetical protein
MCMRLGCSIIPETFEGGKRSSRGSIPSSVAGSADLELGEFRTMAALRLRCCGGGASGICHVGPLDPHPGIKMWRLISAEFEVVVCEWTHDVYQAAT